MTVAVAHRIVRYDRKTDRMTVSYGIPRQHVRTAAHIAKVPNTDRNAVMGAYPLEPTQAKETAGLIGRRLDFHRDEYFFEPVAVPEAISD